MERKHVAVPGTVSTEVEEQLLLDLNLWIVDQELPEGEFIHELVDEETGEPLAVLDLAWPEGLHPV